jgi:dCMP deaminase
MASKLSDFFIKTAFLLAENSKCVSHHVGSVIVKDDRIISMGYNGSPPGLPNCNEVFDPNNFDRAEHSKWSGDHEIHAEMNAIAFAAKNYVEVDGCDMYSTISPCNECLKNISMTGIKNVYYLYKYDRIDLTPAILKKVNIEEVPNSAELKEWVKKNNLLYVPKQRKNESGHNKEGEICSC